MCRDPILSSRPSHPTRWRFLVNSWTDDLSYEPWRARRARRQRMIGMLVILALALPGAAALLSLLR